MSVARGLVISAYDAFIAGGKVAGGLLAIGGVAYVPVRTLLEVQNMNRMVGEMQEVQDDMRRALAGMRVDIADIKAAILSK